MSDYKERRYAYMTNPMVHHTIDALVKEFLSKDDDELAWHTAIDLFVLGDVFLVHIDGEVVQVGPESVSTTDEGIVVRPRHLPPAWEGPTELSFAPGAYQRITLDREKAGDVPKLLGEPLIGRLDPEAVERWREEWERARKELDAFRLAA